jgi:hypothetical protein
MCLWITCLQSQNVPYFHRNKTIFTFSVIAEIKILKQSALWVFHQQYKYIFKKKQKNSNKLFILKLQTFIIFLFLLIMKCEKQ